MLIFIAFWAVILLVVPYLCLFSLILQGLFEEGEFRQLEFWTGKGANLSPLFCTTPNALKIYVEFFGNILKILGERSTRGELLGPHKPGSRHPPLGGGYRACRLPDGPLAPPFCYMKGFIPEKKIIRELFRGFAAATRRNLSRSNLELRQDDPAGETSLPEGEIVAIVITNTPLIGGDSSPSTSSSAPSHLQTLVHLL